MKSWMIVALWLLGAGIAFYANFVSSAPHISNDDPECGMGAVKYDC